MSRYAALAKRVARAEQAAARSKRRFPRIAFFISDAPEATVEGFSTFDGVEIPREPEEALSATLGRAWQHPNVGTALFAIYPEPDEAPEEAPGQFVSWPEPKPQPDLAGIGRVDEKYRDYWRPEREGG